MVTIKPLVWFDNEFWKFCWITHEWVVDFVVPWVGLCAYLLCLMHLKHPKTLKWVSKHVPKVVSSNISNQKKIYANNIIFSFSINKWKKSPSFFFYKFKYNWMCEGSHGSFNKSKCETFDQTWNKKWRQFFFLEKYFLHFPMSRWQKFSFFFLSNRFS